MYARLQTTDRVPTGADAQAGMTAMLDVVAGHPGFRGIYALNALGTVTGHLISFWDTAEDATEASDRTRARMGQAPPVTLTSDRVLTVKDAWAGAAAGETPQVASVMFIDGPCSDARLAAGQRAHHQRILPAVRGVPGIVGGWALVDEEHSAVRIIALATSLDALAAASDAVMATELLPGEDPALLSAPDRVDACHIAGLRAGVALAPTV